MKTSVKINENKKLQKNCHLSILFLTPKNFFFCQNSSACMVISKNCCIIVLTTSLTTLSFTSNKNINQNKNYN